MKRTLPLTPIARALGSNQLVRLKQTPSWQQRLSNVGNYLLDLFAGDSSAPIITEHPNPKGANRWSVYDPYSQTERQFNSEEEVRIWLEQRYYDVGQSARYTN